MPQENWVAIQDGHARDPGAVLREYGWVPTATRSVEFPGTVSALFSANRPSAGQLAFYVIQAPQWMIMFDSAASLWENLAGHQAVSRRLGKQIAVVVSRTTSDAMGYGLFEKGRTQRWIFMQSDVVAQNYGEPPPWEDEVLVSPAEIGERLRQRLGISWEGVREATVLFAPAAPVGERKRRKVFRWPFRTIRIP
jgi:hypothetical protein